MANKNMGSYAPGSNLKEDWDGTIREVVFEKQENSQNYAAHLIIDSDDGEEVEIFAGLGGDWASYDGGQTVEHPKGENRKFQGSTYWSRLLVAMFDSVVQVEGDTDNEMLRRDRAANGKAAQVASSFAGLRFHWDIKKVSENRPVDVEVTNSDGTTEKKREWQQVEIERMFPDRYLGIAGGQMHPQGVNSGAVQQSTIPHQATESVPQPVESQASQGQSSHAAASNQGQAAVDRQPVQSENTGQAGAPAHPALGVLPVADQIKLKQLAKTSDYGAFVDAVMDLTGSDGRAMLDVPEVIQSLSDENFYLTLRG